jgi:nicotinamide-nucleotide adenylyltransferase
VKSEKAVFLGRFQPFHKGHHETVKEYKQQYEDFVVAIGSAAKSGTERNPLSFQQRKEILESCHPEIEIVAIEDEDRGEKGYQDWTERFVEKTDPDVVITRNDLVQRLVRQYSDAEIEEQELYNPDTCSGTKIRKKIREEKDWLYMVPDCDEEKIEEYKDVIAETGR